MIFINSKLKKSVIKSEIRIYIYTHKARRFNPYAIICQLSNLYHSLTLHRRIHIEVQAVFTIVPKKWKKLFYKNRTLHWDAVNAFVSCDRKVLWARWTKGVSYTHAWPRRWCSCRAKSIYSGGWCCVRNAEV